MLIYYAHSKLIYNTDKEKKQLKDIEEELCYLKEEFGASPHIINPNGWIYNNGNESSIMKQCLKFVENCDVVIFSTINSGIIGKGVYEEIKHALDKKIDVYILTTKGIKHFSKQDFKEIEMIFARTNTWKKYAKISNFKNVY